MERKGQNQNKMMKGKNFTGKSKYSNVVILVIAYSNSNSKYSIFYILYTNIIYNLYFIMI